MPKNLGKLAPLAVLFLAVFLFFWRLGGTHLTNWDEAWYADIARTMAESGNFLTPMWNGQPFLEKPPLYHWLTAISYRVFGDSEFSARFVSAVSGIGTVGLLYWFSKKNWGELTAILSSLILLSTPAFLWRARTGNLDSLLTFLIFLSATAPKMRGAASGLAFLTKGVIGFLFPIIALRVRELVLGVTIAVVWFSLSYFINGQLFTQQFFAQQGEKIGSLTTLFSNFSLDYLIHLKTGLKFWVIVFVPAVFYLRTSIFSRFIIVYLILLSFLQEKSMWFLHPIYPFIALICGLFLSRWKKPTVFVLVIAISLFQLAYYRHEYFVVDVARDEALVAVASKELTDPNDVIYLTHYYYPAAVYYSRRRVYAVYSEHPSPSFWILPKSNWNEILTQERVFINTNKDDLRELERQFPTVDFEILFSSGDKLLVKKV